MNRTDELLANELKAILDKNTAIRVTSNGREINDNEAMHLEADELLVEVLEAIGYKKSAEQYKEMKQYFWYA